MKVRNILAGIAGAVSVLVLTAAASHAAYPTCNSGNIVPCTDPGMGAVGSGYIAPSGAFYAGNRYVCLTCDSGKIVNDSGSGWTGTPARTFMISSNAAYDPDGKYATVLTEVAMGNTKKVTFSAFGFGTTSPDNAVTAGRVIMSFGFLP